MTSMTFSHDPFARANRGKRSSLRNWTSAIALATVLAMPVRESVAGNAYAGSAPGSADYSIFNSGGNSETIVINTPTAVINWTPDDVASGGTPIDFLPAGKTVTYENDVDNLGGYTVLNRIVPTGGAAGRGVALNGTVIANLLDVDSEVVGKGNVWFYSPNGLLAGSTARFDVGSLVLSTIPIGFQNSTAATGVVSTGDAVAGSTVRIAQSDSGRGIFADNYVGVLAPKIEQAGSVNAGGSVAYVAAEAANLSFNNGLFDISVSTGSTAATAITHDGATRVTADGSGTRTGIYLVAVPKNVAMTMLLTDGELDFTLANSAVATDQGVVLSAGRDVLDGSGSTVGGGLRPVSAGNIGTQAVTITGGDIAVASDALVHVRTSRDLTVSGGTYGGAADIFTGGNALTVDTSAGATTFDSTTTIDTSLTGTGGVTGGAVHIGASGGEILTFTGAVTIDASGNGQSSSGAAGGDISVNADGTTSIVNFNGGLTANANGTGASDVSSAPGGAGTGGTIYLTAANSGRINIVGGATLMASGIGGNSGGTAGNAQGGAIGFDADGGTIVTGGNLSLQAFAKGGDGATGGTATARILGNMSSASAVVVQARSGGSLTHTGNLQMTANALGGLGMASGSSGAASAGEILLNGDGGQVTINGAITATANASLATSVAGGNATGGVLRILGAGSTSNGVIMGDYTGNAAAIAGNSVGSGQPGGVAQGGAFHLTANGGAAIDGEALSVNLAGTGGTNSSGSGGSGTGGTLTLFTNGSSAMVDFAEAIDLNVGGQGGDGSNGGGLGNGGTVNASILSNGGSMILHGFSALGEGRGGNGGAGRGGDGIGGFLRLVADAGTITSSDAVILRANSAGGDGATGGDAIAVTGMTPRGFVGFGGAGGSINHSGSVELRSNSDAGGSLSTGAAGTATGGGARLFNSGSGTVSISGNVTASADARIASGEGNGGGAATGGYLELSATGSGNLTLSQNYTATALGYGGDATSGSSASAGLGLGGTLNIQSNGSNTLQVLADIDADVSGFGGDAQAGAGGEGRGGLATLSTGANGGQILADYVDIKADGDGGSGNSAGGLGQGGTAIVATNAAGGNVEGDFVFLSAQGYGGNASGSSSTGGTGRGGVAGFRAYQGSIEIAFRGVADASGRGGDGQIGGNGFGGAPPGLDEGDLDPYFGAFANSFSGEITVLGSGEGGGLYLYSTGTGGSGGPNSSGTIGASGNGVGGYVESLAFLDDSSEPGESSVDIGFLYADVTGLGGEGHDATSMATVAGQGGNGTGGRMLIAATAGKGSVNVDEAELYAYGFGGEGGSGNGEGALGTGGAGGSGTGGSIQVGMISGLPTTNTNGQATFGGLRAVASGLGGEGGDGANGDDSVNGGNGTDGGAGGSATGGNVLLSGFGAPVVAGDVTLLASAQAGFGGEGGAASGSTDTVDGNGGSNGLSATGGRVNVLVAPRSMVPTQLGSIQADSLTADVTAHGGTNTNVAGGFLIRTSGGNLSVTGTTALSAQGDTAPAVASEVSAQNGTITFTGPFTGDTVGPVNFFLDQDGMILRPAGCTVNQTTCAPMTRTSPPPPPPVVSPPPPPPVVSPPPPPPVVSPPPPPPVVSPPPPPPVVSPPPPPPPPPVVSPPPPPPPPPPVVSPPPPPPPPVVSPPPPPPPPAQVPEVMDVVETETTNIISNIQATLTSSRVAGGSVSSTPPPAAPPPAADSGSSSGSSAGEGGGSGGSSESSGSSASAAPDGGSSEEAAADEGGDDEDSGESAASDSGGTVGNPNVLVDVSTIGSTSQEIDVPVTSSGNSSLWQGADGLGDLPGETPGGETP